MALSGTVLLTLGMIAGGFVLAAATEFGSAMMLAAAAGDTGGLAAQWWARMTASWQEGFRHAPVLMIGLITSLAVPILAILGLVLARRRRQRSAAPVLAQHQDEAGRTSSPDGLTWPVDAWIELENQPASRQPVVREILRIGRDDDNDLVVPSETVHRFHAVINRTEDAEIVVIDMSGSDGNGVVVNGKRVSRQRLVDGDVIELGKARLKFSARRVGAISPRT